MIGSKLFCKKTIVNLTIYKNGEGTTISFQFFPLYWPGCHSPCFLHKFAFDCNFFILFSWHWNCKVKLSLFFIQTKISVESWLLEDQDHLVYNWKVENRLISCYAHLSSPLKEIWVSWRVSSCWRQLQRAWLSQDVN